MSARLPGGDTDRWRRWSTIWSVAAIAIGAAMVVSTIVVDQDTASTSCLS